MQSFGFLEKPERMDKSLDRLFWRNENKAEITELISKSS